MIDTNAFMTNGMVLGAEGEGEEEGSRCGALLIKEKVRGLELELELVQFGTCDDGFWTGCIVEDVRGRDLLLTSVDPKHRRLRCRDALRAEEQTSSTLLALLSDKS